MELSQLEYFKELAAIRHFTAAAQSIAISQPALSRSIKRLEEELGVPLFDRVGKSIRLTRYGEIFLEYATRALEEIKNGRQALAALSAPTKGIVNLGFLHSLGTYLVPELIRQSHALFPQIQFTLTQNNSVYLLQPLLDGKVDLLLSSELTAPLVKWEPLCLEELFVVVPRGHRLARRGSIHLAEIAAEPIVTFKPEYNLRALCEDSFASLHLAPHIAFEGDEIMTVASLVSAGLGVSLIPHIPGLEHLDIVFLPVQAPKCIRSIGLCWNGGRHMPPAVQKIRRFMSDAFHSAGQLKLEPYYKPLP